MQSPNYGERPKNTKISLIIIHGTEGTDVGDLAWIRDPASQVSYHYLILRDGRIYNEVDEDARAWHAGVSSWKGVPNCNDYSIGIGLSNLGPGREDKYTDAQYRALNVLLWDIQHRRGELEIVGHSDVSPGRKSDPWPHFDWSRIISLPEPKMTRPVLSISPLPWPKNLELK